MHSRGSSVRRIVVGGGVAAALAAAAIVAPGAGAAGHQSQGLPYENARLPVKARVDDLVSRMTLAEKIGQMTQAERAGVDADTSKITTDNLGSVLSGGG